MGKIAQNNSSFGLLCQILVHHLFQIIQDPNIAIFP